MYEFRQKFAPYCISLVVLMIFFCSANLSGKHAQKESTVPISAWLTFSNPEYEVQFSYPSNTNLGGNVTYSQYKIPGASQVLFTSEDREEFYFDMAKLSNSKAYEIYNTLKKNRDQRSMGSNISDVTRVIVSDRPAISFEVYSEEGDAVVTLVEYEKDVYRFIYRKHPSALERQVMETVRFRAS